MDEILSGNREKTSVSNGPSLRRTPSTREPVHHVTTIIVNKDERGYGMKVSGDNPVYVQSVKEGGAAERAGLHSGDKIIKVNGVNVTHSTHTEVVELIKSSTEVILTVQQWPTTMRASSIPSTPTNSQPRTLHHHLSAPARDHITGPKPVDHEKQRQVECQRVHTLRLMLEKEQRYVEALRSELAKCSDNTSEPKILHELNGAERRVKTLQEQLIHLTGAKTDIQPFTPPPPPLATLPTRQAFSMIESSSESPPPLPQRNRPFTIASPPTVSPPPLPPRQYLLNSTGLDAENENAATNSVNASSTSNSASTNPLVQTHHRTKSSPDQISNLLGSLSLSEASKRLIASESISDLCLGTKRAKGGIAWDVDSPRITPPGTPPPPYPLPAATSLDSTPADPSSPLQQDDPDSSRGEPPPNDSSGHLDASPIKTNHGAFVTQQPIISMEDDEMSDQEMNQLEDHGPFKSLSKLWEHDAHLAVFMNYVISNSDPSSLLFYLVTDLYKEGNGKEMKKWAYEIHSSFLVPGAPLRLNNVDENVAREIDEVLLNESDKEEILRKIFWKARVKAKEELNEQLADFQQKRTAGLGTLFGPTDAQLDESIHDKSKEQKIIEQILIPKMEPFIEDMEHEVVDDRRFTMAAALGTIIGKVFGIRGQHFSSLLDRCPTFVSKEKSLKARLIGRSRKVTVRGHNFVAHQYYTVTYCNHCQLIIWGIGPQGYQCTNCNLNIHRPCVKTLEENCPGPLERKKEKGNDRISKLMERIRPERETRRKPSSLNIPLLEKAKRQNEEKENDFAAGDNETGERPTVGGSRERRGCVDLVKEAEERGSAAVNDDDSNHLDIIHHAAKTKSSATSINRSESYKERFHQKRQLRERRKTSDPNLSKTNSDIDVDHQGLTYHTNSGSSSNSSLSTRSLESPSNSLETVTGGGVKGEPLSSSTSAPQWDSDAEVEPDPPDWTKNVPEDVLRGLSPREKKRQEVINELFHTERSHVRGLKVLDQIFYQPMKEASVLPQDQIQLLFSNLEEMLDIHSTFNNSMKAKRRETPVVGDIGDLLLDMFDGTEGENFQKAAANFCSRQQIALEALKERRRKDPKLNSFLTDAEGNPMCRRLQLKDIIPTGMLRLTKYPLLFENLAKYTRTERSEEEERHVLRALERSKEILNYVNQAVREAEDQHRLADIQRKLDKTSFDKTDHPLVNEFKSLDLTKHRLIHEGVLNWRIGGNRQKVIELHIVLLEDIIILLQRQDEKFVLKFHNMNSGGNLSPILKVSHVLVRHNAVDKKALYLVNTSHNNAQIYDLVATSSSERKTWFKHISDAAVAYQNKDGKNRRPELSPAPLQDLDPATQDKTKESDSTISSNNNNDLLTVPAAGGSTVSNNTENGTSPASPTNEQNLHRSDSASRKLGSNVADPLRLTEEQSELIQPNQVVVSQRSVQIAEPILTPLEKLRRQDEMIKKALAEKQKLVADILHVPHDQFETFAEMASEPAMDKEAAELILAAVSQANQLSAAVSAALSVSEEDAVAAHTKSVKSPSVSTSQLQAISTSLNNHLTQLLNIIAERDEEREKLRREVQRSREQLHAMHESKQKFQHSQEPS